jgi:membrane-bound lytic murein transglycosylase F
MAIARSRWRDCICSLKKTAIIILALALSTCSRPPGALEEILNSGQLRVVTRNSPTTYFRGADGHEGPEFLLAQGFAEFLSAKYSRPVEAQFTVVDRFVDLFPAIEERQAHFAAAGLTITSERIDRVAFGPVYQEVQQHLVYRLNSGRPRTIHDLRGKRLEIMAGSSYAQTLAAIQTQYPDFAWSENPNSEISELLGGVENRTIDYTVADSTAFDVHRHYMPDLAIAMNLKEGDELAWAFHKHDSYDIRVEAHEYFDQIAANGKLTQILERYYGHTDEFDYVGTRTFIRHHDTRLNKYRDLFRQAGRDSATDWRLLAAIGYQESHWNPTAVSPTGVRGLMMLTRTTASYMGVANREDPNESIAAGGRYFKMLRDRLSDVPEPDRTWFALAAYNVGYSHVRDAQRIVRMQGGNPDRWVDLKDALPLLAQRKWYSRVPYGYARGWEPVRHVQNIRTYYEILNWLTSGEESEDRDEPQQADPSFQTASDGLNTTLL